MEKVWVGVDIGGSFVKVGIYDDKLDLLDKTKFETEAVLGTAGLMKNLIEKLQSFLNNNLANKQLAGMGVAMPGKVDSARGVIECANNLPFENFAIGQVLQQTFVCPVWVGHDVQTAAIAEQQKGTLMQVQNAVYLALGTGLGACHILNGKVVERDHGLMTELGHTTLKAGGEACTCGRRGCMEMYVSQKGLLRAMERAKLVKEKTPSEQMAWLFQAGQKNTTAQKIVEQFESDLCDLLLNIQSLYNPDKIVFGGGLCYYLPALFPALKQKLNAYRFGYYKGLTDKIEIGTFQNDATVWGAAYLIKNKTTN